MYLDIERRRTQRSHFSRIFFSSIAGGLSAISIMSLWVLVNDAVDHTQIRLALNSGHIERK